MEIPTTPSIAANGHASEQRKGGIDWAIFWISGGFFLLFLIAALVNLRWLSTAVDTAFGWATKGFGLYWQVLMLATFAVSLGIAFSKLGRVKLGGIGQVPSNSTFNWVVIIMCALLAGGGAFWAAAEPLMHFVNPPPFYGVEGRTYAAGVAALSQSFLHWGFLAWAVLGSLLSIVLMHLHYDKGLPLAPRTLLYPLFGERALKGPIAAIADATSIIAVAAGTIGPVVSRSSNCLCAPFRLERARYDHNAGARYSRGHGNLYGCLHCRSRRLALRLQDSRVADARAGCIPLPVRADRISHHGFLQGIRYAYSRFRADSDVSR